MSDEPHSDSDDARRVPNPTVERLSVYARVLASFRRDDGVTTSSNVLAQRTGFSAAQIRRDLAVFGQFGMRGRGYDIASLRARLDEILGVHIPRRVALVGAGNLGLALLGYTGFREHNFDIVAAFDVAPGRVGANAPGGIPIHHLDDLPHVASAERVEIAVLAVPVTAAQATLDAVARAGIQAVLNFAPTRLDPPEGVRLRNVDLSVELEALSFYLAHESDTPAER
ncbi:redox-sensing transcriptional repressor Rex [Candidatus Poribacteria bacterium]|nr:redox-sensing transcriptional repressor Rex [Candidatus Poribacteria bacterium]MBT5537139.1 redox-sensing transcriptional repressor Rex [Candidatus Poribacteria bacterium]MBT5713846.1 redox-sensing transcriptional repressor Rex [Candidatus Poribacteria bacterium]MBT7100282.1 redox-sensing transcriptional repressor Rex [Candidatus Poribacteria bacterium]MBT7806591.1 redox-sensing transcriptional repressor Rex [Candidatus Poribacteria bacterium]